MDERILEAVIRAEIDGEGTGADSVLERFPEQASEVEAARSALADYQTRVRSERRQFAVAHQNATLEPGTRLGDFEIGEVLGRGAMGVVYRARQRSLGDREVALKVLPAALVAKDPRFIDRFRREADLASRVHHPGLAEVYGFGSEGRTLYFAMRLVQGRTLGDVFNRLLLRRRLGDSRHTQIAYVRRVVRLARQVAEALGAIHAEGLVHRDVKPANIILEDAGDDGFEALAARPVLVDFGLIRPAGASDLTGSLTLLGTPAYASPESRTGKAIDPRADVFSLGTVLHDLLGMSAPGQRRPAAAGLAPIGLLNPAVDEPLAAILEKALEERPVLRYPDSAALREDLDHWLERRPVRARPATILGRARRWARRRPGRAVRAALLMTVALALVVGVTWLTLHTVGLYRAAFRFAALEREGDLVGASRAARPLEAGGPLVTILPGLEDGRARADAYHAENAPLAEPVALLGVNTEEALQSAHARFHTILLTPRLRPWRVPVLAFLAREITGAPEMWRRRLAAETLSHYLLIEPMACPANGPSDSIAERLKSAVFSMLSNAASDEDDALRRSLISAASGLIGQESLEVITACIRHADAESRFIAGSGSMRLLEQMEQSGRLGEFSDSDLVAWINGLWESACIHSRTKPDPEPAAAGFEGVTIRALLWLAYQRGGGEHPRIAKASFTSMDSEARRLLRQADAAFVVYRTNPKRPPVYLQSKEAWTKRLLRVRNVHGDFTDLETNAPIYVYENIWDADAPLAIGDETNESLDAGALRAGLEFQAGQAILRGSAIKASWRGAQIDSEMTGYLHSRSRSFLLFSHPGLSELTLVSHVPPGSTRARIHIAEERAGRWLLPESGAARARVSIGDDTLSVARMAPLLLFHPLRFEISRGLLAGRTTLPLRIRLASASTTYRVHRVEIEFTREEP